MFANDETSEGMSVDRRRAPRKLLNQNVQLSLPGEITLKPCGLRDLTVFGAGLHLEAFKFLPTEFVLSFDGFRTTFTCRLVWRDRVRGGVEFQP